MNVKVYKAINKTYQKRFLKSSNIKQRLERHYHSWICSYVVLFQFPETKSKMVHICKHLNIKLEKILNTM